MLNQTDYDNLPLPDVSETEILEAAKQKKLGATPKGSVYRWRVTGTSRDVSDPEMSGKGWLMAIIESIVLKPTYNEDGTVSGFEPGRDKAKTWLVLPRMPSKEILVKRGYDPDHADKVLAAFNPNGTNDFAIQNFTRWARAFYPEQFPRLGGFDKDVDSWVSYNADGTVKEQFGNGPEGKVAVRKLQEAQIGAVKAFAGTLFANPSQVIGKEFYDGYKYETLPNGETKDFGALAGYPNATLPVSKDGVVYTICDPTKNVMKS